MAIDPARPLLNQVALVTGGNSGIGEACALALGVAGAHVVVNDFSDPEEGGSDAIATIPASQPAANESYCR